MANTCIEGLLALTRQGLSSTTCVLIIYEIVFLFSEIMLYCRFFDYRRGVWEWRSQCFDSSNNVHQIHHRARSAQSWEGIILFYTVKLLAFISSFLFFLYILWILNLYGNKEKYMTSFGFRSLDNFLLNGCYTSWNTPLENKILREKRKSGV